MSVAVGQLAVVLAGTKGSGAQDHAAREGRGGGVPAQRAGAAPRHVMLCSSSVVHAAGTAVPCIALSPSCRLTPAPRRAWGWLWPAARGGPS